MRSRVTGLQFNMALLEFATCVLCIGAGRVGLLRLYLMILTYSGMIVS